MGDEGDGRGGLRVLPGGGEGRPLERLTSRDAVARVLVGATADLLLRRIAPARAHSIHVQVERVLLLFDEVDGGRVAVGQLAVELDALQGLARARADG
ncbi:MAG: hypothetical protein ACLQDQ_00675 [Myxococcaceae bacterium]